MSKRYYVIARSLNFTKGFLCDGPQALAKHSEAVEMGYDSKVIPCVQLRGVASGVIHGAISGAIDVPLAS